MAMNPYQFSAGPNAGINTSVNYGDNAINASLDQGTNAYEDGGDSDRLRRRRRKDKEDSLVPSNLSVPSMAAAAAGALSLSNSSSNVMSGVGNFVKSGVGEVAKAGEGFLGKAQKTVGGGLEDLTIAAKKGGSWIGDTLGKIGEPLGAGVDLVESIPGRVGNFGKPLGGAVDKAESGIGQIGKGLGSVWDAIEPSGGLIGSIGGGIKDFAGNIAKGATNTKEVPSDEKWKQEMGDAMKSSRIDPATGKPQGEIDNPGSWYQTPEGGWSKGSESEYNANKNRLEKEDKASRSGSWIESQPSKPFAEIPYISTLPDTPPAAPGLSPSTGNFAQQFAQILENAAANTLRSVR